jgi:hypothetical protein
MTTTATAAKQTNYTAAQEAIMVAAIKANKNIADKSVAETLAADERMNAPADNVKPGPRTVRSIVAKLRRIVDSNDDFSYERVGPVTKDGKPVTKKLDLVKRIVELSGIPAGKLDGLDKAPKLALDMLAEAFASRDDEAEDEREAA